MTKRILVTILLVTVIISCVSCKKPVVESSLSSSSLSSSSGSSGFANTLIPISDNANILFIGNSLTHVGQIPQKFNLLKQTTNKTGEVFQKTNGGYKLFQHLDDLKSGSYNMIITKEDIDKTDVVILQEYGSFGFDTANSVIQIQKLFKEKTKFYFLLTEFDIPRRINELKKIKNITYIPSGYAHNLLLKDGYTYSQLHQPGDYHPNSLYGYIATLTVYSILYNTSCIGLTYDFLDNATVDLIPGLTKAEKDQSIKKIQEKVMVAVNAKQSEYR